MKIAIITGASSGMGREFAKQIAKKYRGLDEIWVLARSIDALISLQEEIKNVAVRVIPCDVTKEEELKVFDALLKQKKPFVRVLVNAAGFGILGHFDNQTLEDSKGMCDLNCTALTVITRMVCGYMKGRRANIINIASAAAFVPQPSFAVYAATKSYVLSFSTALYKELRPHGICVTAVCPGPVNTEFFDKAEIYTKVKAYKYLFRVKKESVVSKALHDAAHGKHISVYGVSMKMLLLAGRLLPHRFIIKFIS